MSAKISVKQLEQAISNVTTALGRGRADGEGDRVSPVYEFVGGPKDGLCLETSGAYEVRFPVIGPLRLPTKVTQIRKYREPSFDVISYYRAGDVYRWEGLIEDAWCDLDVSEEILAEGGSAVRHLVREQMRKDLEGLASGKELGRIVWRARHSPRLFNVTFRAIVGPRRRKFGLACRTEWRAAERIGRAIG